MRHDRGIKLHIIHTNKTVGINTREKNPLVTKCYGEKTTLLNRPMAKGAAKLERVTQPVDCRDGRGNGVKHEKKN